MTFIRQKFTLKLLKFIPEEKKMQSVIPAVKSTVVQNVKK